MPVSAVSLLRGCCELGAAVTSSSASFHSRAFVFFSLGFSAMPKMRVSTRMTLPSRIGVGWLKAMLQIAPAV